MGFAQIQTTNLRDQVVAQVRRAIIEGRLRPNDHITETRLTRELGVSRTPVREALILLEREGLVVSAPNRGSFVRAFTPTEVSEIFSLRTTLENFAAELIVEQLTSADFNELAQINGLLQQALAAQDFQQVRRIDMDFHRYLIDRSGHKLLRQSFEQIVAQIAALIFLRAAAFPDFNEYGALRDHDRILDAYRARDLVAVQQLNREINQRVCRECISALKTDD